MDILAESLDQTVEDEPSADIHLSASIGTITYIRYRINEVHLRGKPEDVVSEETRLATKPMNTLGMFNTLFP